MAQPRKSIRASRAKLAEKQRHSKIAWQPSSPRVFGIGETRQGLPHMVSSLESGSSASYVLGRYGKPTAALVSYDRFETIAQPGNKKKKMALLIVDELLPNAPQHLRGPAIEELSTLPDKDLWMLWRLDELPRDDTQAEPLRRRMSHPIILDRLRRRARIASAIAEAHGMGFYDAAEHAANQAIDGKQQEDEWTEIEDDSSLRE